MSIAKIALILMATIVPQAVLAQIAGAGNSSIMKFATRFLKVAWEAIAGRLHSL